MCRTEGSQPYSKRHRRSQAQGQNLICGRFKRLGTGLVKSGLFIENEENSHSLRRRWTLTTRDVSHLNGAFLPGVPCDVRGAFFLKLLLQKPTESEASGPPLLRPNYYKALFKVSARVRGCSIHFKVQTRPDQLSSNTTTISDTIEDKPERRKVISQLHQMSPTISCRPPRSLRYP